MIQITLVVFRDLTDLVVTTRDRTPEEHAWVIYVCLEKDGRKQEDIIYSHHKILPDETVEKALDKKYGL